MPSRVAIIGHFVAAPLEIPLPKARAAARSTLSLYNYTRVLDGGNALIDHIAYLKRQQGRRAAEPFSVWEMQLCSVLLLASHLRRHGHGVLTLNYIDSDNEAESFRALRDYDPDVILVSTTFVLSKKHLHAIGSRLRIEGMRAFLLAGGHHVFTTLMHMTEPEQDEYLRSSQFDGFINDTQGEAALLAFCEELNRGLAGVPNLLWRDSSGNVQRNKRLAETNNINDTLIDVDGVPEGSVVHIRTARSCSFKCAFCSYPTIAGDLALMDLDNVMRTLRQCADRGVKSLFFVDDTFNVPRPRFEALLDRMIAEGFSFPWYSFLRCQYVDVDLVRKMRRSGCAGVFLGVESGSDKILQLMKKGAVTKFYRDGVEWLRNEGITAVGSFIVGFPGETKETVEQTREFIEGSNLEYYFIQPFYYLKHTPIHHRAAEFGLTGGGLTWSHRTMNWQEAVEHCHQSFRSIRNSTWVNPDYTLWEIAYLRSKGMSDPEIKSYRQQINRLTVQQMEQHEISAPAITSRSA